MSRVAYISRSMVETSTSELYVATSNSRPTRTIPWDVAQKQPSTPPVFYKFSAPSKRGVVAVDVFQGKKRPTVSKAASFLFLSPLHIYFQRPRLFGSDIMESRIGGEGGD